MSKSKAIFGGLILMIVGALCLGGVQFVMHKTSTQEFCESCHSMSYPNQEWQGTVHFSNRKGIRAQCADCHIPDSGIHYVKAKFTALKDLWYTIVVDKLPDQAAYEKHRLELAQHVWDDMKANDSMTCRSCHSFEAMTLSAQSSAAQKMHKLAQETQQTCIDCHKGIAHFMPETPTAETSAKSTAVSASDFSAADKTLYAAAMTGAELAGGEEVRLMPYAELTDWKAQEDKIAATVKGWQQDGAESVVYLKQGQRIIQALLEEDAQEKVKVLQKIHDDVTDSEWREIAFEISLPKAAVTNDLAALNAQGEKLNQTHCGGCHAVIGADHYTANQWVGVVNSMKDRTSMSKEEVRALTIYLQRNAKDMVGSSH